MGVGNFFGMLPEKLNQSKLYGVELDVYKRQANNGKTDADLLSGAGFTVYLKSSLTKKADGSYDFDSAKPVVSGENGATEIRCV